MSAALKFQCRTRLCGWCSNTEAILADYINGVSMPHAALWVVQLLVADYNMSGTHVSMPHAALWVVQRLREENEELREVGFNAARGFVGGAAKQTLSKRAHEICFNAARGFVGGAAGRGNEARERPTRFNAARGFVGGAASSLSALFPLGGKSTFGKSPEIREF